MLDRPKGERDGPVGVEVGNLRGEIEGWDNLAQMSTRQASNRSTQDPGVPVGLPFGPPRLVSSMPSTGCGAGCVARTTSASATLARWQVFHVVPQAGRTLGDRAPPVQHRRGHLNIRADDEPARGGIGGTSLAAGQEGSLGDPGCPRKLGLLESVTSSLRASNSPWWIGGNAHLPQSPRGSQDHGAGAPPSRGYPFDYPCCYRQRRRVGEGDRV